jgi:multimeric flavodoxin WrbA
MGRIIIIYHSQQFGNTGEMAKALAEGAREASSEVELINTNEKRIKLSDLLGADAVAIGTPDYYGYPAGTIKTLFDDLYLWDKSGEPVKGKPAALFYSHGGGGTVIKTLEKFSSRFFEQIGETIERGPKNAQDAIKKCRALGKKLAEQG